MTWLAALAALASIVGPARAIDGDTLRIGATRIRLYGIDAPELHQLCGSGSRRNTCGRAADALGRAVEGRTVTCMSMDIDRYGRTVAVCRSAGRHVGEELVSRGLAVAYRRYSTRYVGTEDVAHAKRLGMWSDVFQPPAEFRARRRGDGARPGEAVSAPNPSCTINGNVSSKGARIYHVPGGRDYAKVRIATPKGERWFCSEAEAEAAGWRLAR